MIHSQKTRLPKQPKHDIFKRFDGSTFAKAFCKIMKYESCWGNTSLITGYITPVDSSDIGPGQI